MCSFFSFKSLLLSCCGFTYLYAMKRAEMKIKLISMSTHSHFSLAVNHEKICLLIFKEQATQTLPLTFFPLEHHIL